MRRRASTAPCRFVTGHGWAEGCVCCCCCLKLRLHGAHKTLAGAATCGQPGGESDAQHFPTDLQEEAEAVNSQLAAAATQLEQARAEIGDAYAQWELDRGELVEEIRWGISQP